MLTAIPDPPNLDKFPEFSTDDDVARLVQANVALQADPEYCEALAADPVAAGRTLIASCRASGNRRSDFKKVIATGNKENTFRVLGDNDRETTVQIPEVQLLKDVEVRWSSTFLMLDRLLHVWPVRLPYYPRKYSLMMIA